MVSFCCDICQSVVKKPKAAAHLAACGRRGGTLSCIDCGGTFSSAVRPLRAHASRLVADWVLPLAGLGRAVRPCAVTPGATAA